VGSLLGLKARGADGVTVTHCIAMFCKVELRLSDTERRAAEMIRRRLLLIPLLQSRLKAGTFL